MPRIMIVSKVTFRSQREEKENIKAINFVKKFLERNGFEVLDLRSLLIEANQHAPFYPKGDGMSISDMAWINFCCIRYVLTNLAYCNYIFVCENSEDCMIALQAVTTAQMMGLSFIYLNDKKTICEEKCPEKKLPYIDYADKDDQAGVDEDGGLDNADQADDTKHKSDESDSKDWFERHWR